MSGSILGPLFFVYITDMSKVMYFSHSSSGLYLYIKMLKNCIIHKNSVKLLFVLIKFAAWLEDSTNWSLLPVNVNICRLAVLFLQKCFFVDLHYITMAAYCQRFRNF